MSFAQLLRSADARLRLDLVRPAAPRIDGEQAPPARLPAPLAAAAVAAAVREELARRGSGERGLWLAERAPEQLDMLAPDMVAAATRAVSFARSGVGPLAGRALQVARLEAVVRAGYVDAGIGEPELPEDAAEVEEMLARVPWDEFGSRVLPPPAFPMLADALPDVEPDLIADGTMFHVTVSRAPRVDDDVIRALVVRLVIARAAWGPHEAAERVQSVGVLLARHGVVWRAPVEPIVSHEAFPAVEAWFAERLEQATRAAAAPEGEEAPDARPTPLPKWVKKRFAPRPPGTSPEGKAEKKKRRKGKPSSPPPPRATRRDGQDAPPQDEDAGARTRKRSTRPDWRRGSQWRRERGW